MKFNTRYNLRKQDSKKPEKIYLICRFNNERLVYPTAFHCLPKYWNTKTGEIRNVIEQPDRHKINGYLKDLKAAANDIFTEYVISKKPLTRQALRNELNKWTGLTPDIRTDFKKWLQSYIDNSPNRINPRTGRTISKRTIQEYITTQKYLIDFERENRELLNFDTIQLQTLKDFRDYLTTVKGFAVNNIAKHIENLRQFLRAASEDKITIEPDVINPKKLHLATETTRKIYLPENELKAIAEIDLSDRPTYDRVRDLFLIGCNTGLRVSDFNNIKAHHIKENQLEIYQQKTGDLVVIPINETVKIILEKHGGKAPAKVSDQKINKYIKEICKDAGLTDSIEKQQTKAGTKQATICQKWEMVTSHTARRTFATNAVKKGINPYLIMRITGHKKFDVFKKYVVLTPQEEADLFKQYLKAV